MAEDQKLLQSFSDEYQKIQDDLQSTISARQQLESQEQENLSVQKEFAVLADSANIYKLVGPVLLKQDKTDAVGAVNGRLNFIEKEVQRVEGKIKELQDSSEKKKQEVLTLQQKMQLAQP